MRTRRMILAGSCLTVLLAAEAQAAPILFTNRAAWEAAVGSFTTETFNSIVTDTTFTNSIISFAALDVVHTGGATGGVLVDLAPYQFNPGTANIDGTARLNVGGLVNGAVVVLNFHSPVSAVGFDTANYDIDNERLEVFWGATSIGLFPALRDLTGFIGLIETSGPIIGGLTFRNQSPTQNDTFNAFDNVSFAGQVAVPEPASLVLLATGGAVMARRAVRRRRETARGRQ